MDLQSALAPARQRAVLLRNYLAMLTLTAAAVALLGALVMPASAAPPTTPGSKPADGSMGNADGKEPPGTDRRRQEQRLRVRQAGRHRWRQPCAHRVHEPRCGVDDQLVAQPEPEPDHEPAPVAEPDHEPGPVPEPHRQQQPCLGGHGPARHRKRGRQPQRRPSPIGEVTDPAPATGQQSPSPSPIGGVDIPAPATGAQSPAPGTVGGVTSPAPATGRQPGEVDPSVPPVAEQEQPGPSTLPFTGLSADLLLGLGGGLAVIGLMLALAGRSRRSIG